MRSICIISIIAIQSIGWAQSSGSGTPSILKPLGKYRVGHTLIDWVDESRGEPGTQVASDHRKIPVEIWYPADLGADAKPASYRPRASSFRAVWGDESVAFFESVRTSWSEGAAVSSQGPFGMFVFSHGWGARSSSHSTFLSNLASYGYIVVGINHPYLGMVALEDGTITEPNDSQFPSMVEANAFYAADVTCVIDRMLDLNTDDPKGLFTGTIDPERISAGGHSSGFPAVSGAVVKDARIKALISFDAGVPKSVRTHGLDVPILLFRADSNSYTDLFFRGPKVHPKGSIYDVSFFRVHRGDFYDLVISGTTHSSVYDEYLFTDSVREQNLSTRNHRIIERFAHEFLDLVLSKMTSDILAGAEHVEHTSLRIIPGD